MSKNILIKNNVDQREIFIIIIIIIIIIIVLLLTGFLY